MPYTSLLGLSLPTTGSLSGTWGDEVNNAITSLLDSAVAGTTTLSADADVTLTSTDGAANQARAAVILWTAGGTVTRNITAPARSKAYVVINATSGSQSIVIRGTGPTTGVTVAAGRKTLVVWNGTDFVAVAGSLINLTTDVTGTLPAANGGTGLSSPGTNGNVLTSNGTAWTSSAIPPGGLTYVTKTSNYTASDKEGVLANTSGGAFTVTLPATPTTGYQVVVADSGNAWGTNNLTVGRNGSTIVNLAEDLVCDITGASVQLVYDGTTWEVYAQIGGQGGSVVTLAGVQTLTNKDLTSGTNTFPTSLATLTGSQTLTNKTIEAGTFTNGYTEETYTANSSTAITLDLANGSFQIITLTGSATITMPTAVAGKSFILLLKSGAGSFTVTWSTVAWPSGVAPTLTSTASKQDIISFFSDGVKWYGTTVGLNYTP